MFEPFDRQRSYWVPYGKLLSHVWERRVLGVSHARTQSKEAEFKRLKFFGTSLYTPIRFIRRDLSLRDDPTRQPNLLSP